MKLLWFVLLLFAIIGLGVLAPLDKSQSIAGSGTSSAFAESSSSLTIKQPPAAPYAGTFTTVYGWYPSRYGASDAVRMGSYDVLASAGENLFLEFIYGGPGTLFGHVHRTASSGTGPAIPPSH
jgi:hypothetical protein